MSSSFGGGSSGSGGTIRYAIQIDDSQVNSKLSNFQSTLGRLSSATQTSASGLQEFNSTMQGMDSSITSAAKDVDAINNNFRNMDSSLQSTTKEMGALSNNFKGVEGGLTRSNTLLGQGSEATKTFGQRMKSAGSFIKDNALSVGIATSSIIDLISSYTSLQKAQNTLDKAQNVEIGMRNNIIDLTNKHAEAVKKYGANSQEAISIERDLNLLRQKEATQLEKIGIMQEQLNEKTAQTFQGALNDSILFGSSVAQIAGTFTSNSARITKGLGAIKGAFAGISTIALAELGPILGLLDALYIGYQNFTKIFDALDPKTQVVQKLRDVRDILKNMGDLPIFGSLFKGVLDVSGLTKELDTLIAGIEKGTIKTKELGDTTNQTTSRFPQFADAAKQAAIQTDVASLSVAGLNKVMGDGSQVWFPAYIMNMKKWRDEIKSIPPTKEIFDISPDNILFFQEWNKQWDNTGKTIKNIDATTASINKMNDVIEKTGGSSFMESWTKLDLAGALKKQLDDAQKTAETGLDKIIKAFHDTRKGKLDFEINLNKATQKFDKFLGTISKKLDDGGSEGAKKYVESYVKEAEKKMEGAARIQFQPIFDFVEKHKGEDAKSWMDEFLQLIGSMDGDTKKKFTQLLIKDKEWKKFGKSSGDSWTKGFTGALDDAKREANKAAHDIEKALGLKSGDLSFKIGSHARGGLITSAASGTMFTTSGPTLTLAGDNPGGKETVAYIPHNDPGPTLAKIDAMFGTRSNSSGNQPIIINLENVTKIDGNEFINGRQFSKRVKLEVGRNKDKFM